MHGSLGGYIMAELMGLPLGCRWFRSKDGNNKDDFGYREVL